MPDNPRSPAFLLAWVSDSHSNQHEFEECARVTAPTLIRPEDTTPDSRLILGYAAIVAQQTRNRLLFFSELTTRLSDDGDSWSSHGVDWENGLAALEAAPIPMLYLSLTYQGSIVAAGGARTTTILYTDGPVTLDVAAEQNKLRDAITGSVYTDWANYIEPFL